MVAHTATLPMTFRGGSTDLSAQHFIDWAADPEILSGGANVLRKLLGLAGVTLAAGGSQDTRRLLPLLKFERVGVFPSARSWERTTYLVYRQLLEHGYRPTQHKSDFTRTS